MYIQTFDSPSGDSFVSWINDTIEHSRNFIAVWSESYSKSGHCLAEIESAYILKVNNAINKLLPVRVEEFPIKPLYQRYGWINLFEINANKQSDQECLLNAVGFYENREKTTVDKTDANALNNIGWMYQMGIGVERDYNKARDYYL